MHTTVLKITEYCLKSRNGSSQSFREAPLSLADQFPNVFVTGNAYIHRLSSMFFCQSATDALEAKGTMQRARPKRT